MCFVCDGVAQTSAVVTNVARIFRGNTVQASTNVVAGVEEYERAKQEAIAAFKCVDEGLDLRVLRDGYKGGKFSRNWMSELTNWLERQDLAAKQGVCEFVDSCGFRHLISIGNCRIRRSSQRSKARFEAELTAKANLSRAWDALVVEDKSDGAKQSTNGTEPLHFHSVNSSGTHKGIITVLEKVVQGAKSGESVQIVVVGIIPSMMKF